ncbi:MAG: APC family permease, partial [Actinomycetota bacterium]|nr:APC family permease [Actinomycetota bacterium]
MAEATAPGSEVPGSIDRTGSDRAGIYDIDAREDVHLLHRGAIGLWGVLFLTVTGAAPISAMLFNTPISVGFGNGIGTPAGFAFATVILAIFSVGYVEMSRRVTAAGGFYSFISHGLGRELGMASGFSAFVAYCVFEASLAGGFAFFANAKVNEWGWSVPWPWFAFGMVALIAILSYFDVRLSAWVLGIALIGEVLILLVMDFAIFGQGGNNIQGAALNPVEAFTGYPGNEGAKLAAGAAGVGLFFAFWSWVGFEMAPNYGEESKDPKRIVPRAMYISVIGLGVFYTVTSWAAISGYEGTDAAAKQAQSDPALFFLLPTEEFAGGWARSIMSYLIISGAFACGMAFHNTAARYFYSLGRERIAPAVLGRTHPRWRSPHVASLTQSAIAALIVALFVVFVGTGDPTSQAYLQLYGLMAVMGVIIILAIQALVSLAILVYFWRRGEHHWVKTVACPIVAFVAQAIVLYLLFRNIEFLGSGYGYAKILGPIDAAVFVVGLLTALWLERRDRAKYDTIGRLVYE